MRLRMLAVLGLIVVGVGAVGLAVVGPGFGGQAAAQYLTATATLGTVTAQSVATGSIAPNAIYGLAFGAEPALVSSSASSSSSGSSGNGTGSTSWPVLSVSVNVGDAVTKGQVLAAADDSAAQLAVDAAEANLAAATARLASDKRGPDAATKRAAKDSVTQAKLQLAQAIQNRTDTERQNAITLSQAKTAVTRARQRLADDKAAGAPAATLAADQDAITAAKQSLTATQARVTASNNQLTAQVRSARLGVTSAQNGYATKIVPATVIQIQSDTAAVANAEASLSSVKTALAGARLVAPEDGVVTAVNIVAGTMAPSGYAIQLQAGPMIVTGSFTETDIVKLKVGQPATVTVTAAGASVAGTVTQISPVAATTGGSSVVTYAVKVTLTNPPPAVLAGMSASVAVTTAESDNVVTVPASALDGSAGSYTVRVINSDGQSALVSVQVGLVTSSAAEITSGITAGETVAIGTVSSRTSTSTSSGGGGTVISVPGGGFGGGGRLP